MSIKRYAVAAAAAGMVFTGVYGAAAALNVDGGVVQAGSDDTLSCDTTDGVQVVTFTGEAGPAGFPVTSSGVTLKGIDTDCVGRYLMVRVGGDAGATLASGGKVLTSAMVNDTNADGQSDNNLYIDFGPATNNTPAIAVEQIEAVQISIT